MPRQRLRSCPNIDTISIALSPSSGLRSDSPCPSPFFGCPNQRFVYDGIKDKPTGSRAVKPGLCLFPWGYRREWDVVTDWLVCGRGPCRVTVASGPAGLGGVDCDRERRCCPCVSDASGTEWSCSRLRSRSFCRLNQPEERWLRQLQTTGPESISGFPWWIACAVPWPTITWITSTWMQLRRRRRLRRRLQGHMSPLVTMTTHATWTAIHIIAQVRRVYKVLHFFLDIWPL